MGRLLVGFALAVVLVILAVQNLSPMLTLVVLGAPTVTLPFSAWLLGSAAVGVLLALLISTLLRLATPSSRPYRPLGQRVRSDDGRPQDRSNTDRLDASTAEYDTSRDAYTPGTDSPNPRATSSSQDRETFQQTSAFVQPDLAADADGEDWDSYRSPSQWEDWGQQPEPTATAADTTEQRGFRFRQPPYAADRAVDELGAGWEGYSDDPAYDEQGYDSRSYDTYAEQGGSSGQNSYSDDYQDLASGWDDGSTPQPRVHPDGYLYGQSDRDEAVGPPLDDAPLEEGPEDVYDADFRVIIPPYEPDRDANAEAT